MNDPVTVAGSFPPLVYAAAQSERRELIKENRELHMRLKRAERATQGLQRMEILRIQNENLDARSTELLTFKKKSTETLNTRESELSKR